MKDGETTVNGARIGADQARLPIDSCQTRQIHSWCIRMVYLLVEVTSVASYKVNVSLPEHLVSEIDETAEELGLSRSGFIAEASARYVADLKNLSAEELRRKNAERAIASMRRIGAKLTPDDIQGMMDQLRRDRERDTPEGWER